MSQLVHDKRHTTILIRACLSVLLLFLVGCSGGGGGDDCSASINSAQDAAFNNLFTRFGDGWTGGGNPYSVLLPDGRTAWFSSPTYLGTVNPDRSRSMMTPMIDNSVLIQDGMMLTTLHGGSLEAPDAFIPPATPVEQYSPLAAIVEADRLHVFLNASEGVFQFVRNDVATFSLPELELLEITTVNVRTDISYGTALLEQAGFIYIYGVEEVNNGEDKFMHVARAMAGNLLGPWEYFDGVQWSTDPAASARVLEGVASAYSVFEFNGTLFLVSQALNFSERIDMYQGESPVGPWSNRTAVFCIPETGGDLVTANALAHPQLTTSGLLLVSYQVFSLDNPDLVFADADTFRPFFIRVPLDELLAQGS